MRDAVDEVGWDGPSAAFLCRQHDVGKSFKFIQDDGAHAAVFVGIVDEVVGEETVRHAVGEPIGGTFFSQALESFDATLNQMSVGGPGCEPFTCVTIVEIGAGERVVDCAIGMNIVPFEIDDTRVDICSGSGDMDELRCFCVLLRYQTFENFQVGYIYVGASGVWLELFVKILAKSVCDICMDRLNTK